MAHVLIVGGAGFIGQALVQAFIAKGWLVTVFDLSRGSLQHEHVRYYALDVRSGKLPTLSPCDAVINLTGVSINHRFTDDYKKLIWSSRIISTRSLRTWLDSQPWQPKVYIGASAIGYYGDRGTENLDESSPSGHDFMARICVDWEREHLAFSKISIPTIIFRQGYVLGKYGFLGQLLPWYRRGFRVILGNGKQYISWIELRDLVQLYYNAALGHIDAGIYNAVSGAPSTFRSLSQALGRYSNGLIPLYIPAFIIRWQYGELGESLLASQRIMVSTTISNYIRSNELDMVFQTLYSGAKTSPPHP